MAYSQYKKYSIEYTNKLVIIREGTFYSTYDLDSLILKKYFNYNIIKYNDFTKISFPKEKKDYVINKLLSLKIPLVIIDNEIINYDIKDSNYEFLSDMLINIENKKEKIIRYINELDERELDDIINGLGINLNIKV